MATFTFIPSFSATESSKPRVRTFKAGDGYEQRVRFGLRTDPKVWQLTFSERTDTEAGGILAFLEARGGAESFDWTPPQRLGGNRLLWSEAFDNAVWTKYTIGATANAATAPDGLATADKIFENSTANIAREVTQYHRAINTPFTFSLYAKAAERNIVNLALSNDVNSFTLAFFNLSTGVILYTASSGTDFTSPFSSILSAGNGWYRCSISGFKGSFNDLARPLIQLQDASNSYSYPGTIGSGLYVWGAQVEIGSAPSTYTSTTTSTAGVVAAGKYVCEEWDTTMRSANFNTITATFRQVFEA